MVPGPCSENDKTVGGLVRGYHRGGKTLEDAGVARHELDIGICVCVRVCLLSFLDPLHVYKNYDIEDTNLTVSYCKYNIYIYTLFQDTYSTSAFKLHPIWFHLCLRHGSSLAELLSAIGQLPEERSPWVLLNRMQKRWWWRWHSWH